MKNTVEVKKHNICNGKMSSYLIANVMFDLSVIILRDIRK